VFVPHLVTGKFPVPPRPAIVLTSGITEALSCVCPGFRDAASPSIATHAEDERRLFYVAVTRARERVFLSWARRYDADEDDSAPSPFLIEALGGTEANVWRAVQESSETPRTVLERLAGESRRPEVRARGTGDGESIEEASSPEELEVALRRLHSRGEDWARRTIEEVLAKAATTLDRHFVTAADPFPREPAAPLALDRAQVELSASRLTEHRECPRKFFYSKLLHLDRAGGAQAQFGSAVHSVLEAFHTAHADLGAFSDPAARSSLSAELRGRFEAALAAVRESFPTEFEYQRYLGAARSMVVPYVDMLAQEPLRFVAGRELDIRFEASAARLVAKLDRVCADTEALEGAREVLIADYKAVREATTRALTLKKRIEDGSEIQLVTYFQAFKKKFGVAPGYLGKVFLRHKSEWRPGTLEVLLKVQDGQPAKGADFNGRSGRLQTDRAWISEEALDAAWSLIVDRIASIRRADLTHFEITPSKASCRYCSYATVCGKEEAPDAADE